MKKAFKRRKMVTVGTQTALELYPIVVLRKISLPKEYPEEPTTKTKASLTVSKPLAKAPTNYKNFVKRLSNNQKASSTLVPNEIDGNADNYLLPPAPPKRRSYQSKKVKFKPGPRCYKRRLLRSGVILYDDNDDKNVPIMLNEPPSSTHENVTIFQNIIAKAPSKYQHFAKLLSNDEKATSTIGNKEFEETDASTNRRSSQPKKVTFKSGMHCYKSRLLQNELEVENDDDNDMNVPIMLSEQSSLYENVVNLQTIIEQTHENCETPEVAIDDNIIAIEEVENVEIPTVNSLDIAYQDLESDEANENFETEIASIRNKISSIQNKATMATQTEGTAQHYSSQISSSKRMQATEDLPIYTEDRDSQNEEKSLRPNDQNCGNARPLIHAENIHIRFEGVTNILSHQSFHGERKERSSSEENANASRNHNSEPNSSFIKINARNVHIHNHFYT